MAAAQGAGKRLPFRGTMPSGVSLSAGLIFLPAEYITFIYIDCLAVHDDPLIDVNRFTRRTFGTPAGNVAELSLPSGYQSSQVPTSNWSRSALFPRAVPRVSHRIREPSRPEDILLTGKEVRN